MVSVQDIPYGVNWIPGKLNIADCISRLSEVISLSKGAEQFDRDYVVDYDDEEPIDKEEIVKRNKPCIICNVMHMNDFISCNEVSSRFEIMISIRTKCWCIVDRERKRFGRRDCSGNEQNHRESAGGSDVESSKRENGHRQ